MANSITSTANSVTRTHRNLGNGTYADVVALNSSADVLGRLKVSQHQSIYDTSFDYNKQPLYWEELTVGADSSVTHMPRQGGVKLNTGPDAGNTALIQSRAYHHYQPGKTMFMSTDMIFGSRDRCDQRVGFFDDSNGVFFQQYSGGGGDFGEDYIDLNPFNMYCVIRSDAQIPGYVVYDKMFPLYEWNGDQNIIQSIDWTKVQTLWIEYDAGCVRWGVFVQGIQYTLHETGFSKIETYYQYSDLTTPWMRTLSLPVRFELKNGGYNNSASTMYVYGVSVSVEGGLDKQRGFTYSYGMALQTPRRTVAANFTRYPVLSFKYRNMGTQEYTQATAACTAGTTSTLVAASAAWTEDQWTGRHLSYVVSGVTYTARILSNSQTMLTIADLVTGSDVAVAPVASGNYTIGIINRGQILPIKLLVTSSALAQCEIIASNPSYPVTLTGSNFVALSDSTIRSNQSFGERDVSATSMSGGEVVMKFTLPAGGNLLDIDLSSLFPLYNNIKGNKPDMLTLAVTTTTSVSADVGGDFIVQEIMS
jgi:hypothetical protein